MTHVVHPYSHRLGIIRDWKSRWFANRDNYVDQLKGDVMLRQYLSKRLRGYYIANIEIERDKKNFKLSIHTSRPGMIIGRSGEGIEKLKNDILKEMQRKKLSGAEFLKVDIVEVPVPETSAAIVAQMVADGIEKRLPFRRVLKATIEKVMSTRGVKGARIQVSGRLGGAEMARIEHIKKGGIPLQTLRADIDFAREKAYMTYGVIGIKVWIYRGMIFNDISNKATKQKLTAPHGDRGYKVVKKFNNKFK